MFIFSILVSTQLQAFEYQMSEEEKDQNMMIMVAGAGVEHGYATFCKHDSKRLAEYENRVISLIKQTRSKKVSHDFLIAGFKDQSQSIVEMQQYAPMSEEDCKFAIKEFEGSLIWKKGFRLDTVF